MILQEQRLRVFADAYTFELRDETCLEDLSRLWTREAMKEVVAIHDRMIAVLTARNMDVPVTVRHLDAYPQDTVVESWDQIVECGINLRSGTLVVFGNEYFPTSPRMHLGAGRYGVQVCWGNLDSLSEDGLDGDDHYHVSIWRIEQDAVDFEVAIVAR